jgi:hypothetical protein
MSMLIIALVVSALAVARLTRLLVEDQLTVGYRRWVVNKWGEKSMAAYLAHCPWCTSVWVAVPVMPVAVLFPNQWVIAVLAIPAASHVTGLFADRKE